MTSTAAGPGAELLHPVVLHHIVNSLGWTALRPLQDEAVAPVLAGHDALLLAPTAGGKTEAAVFPLLTAMEQERWCGLSVIYVCPLKALLNNLLTRLQAYTGWLGRRTAIWHGDVTTPVRERIQREPPDILLTTPESLEAMLISLKVEHGRFFAGLHAIVIDEVHAFAGDDRGWHLLALLERLSRVVGRPIQRIGLSATVGNPTELLTWLQGTGHGRRPATVIAPEPDRAPTPGSGPPGGHVELDYVGSVGNAATVIASLHRGEKRLVFCDSRRLVEELGAALRERGVETFLSHASLSVDERHRAEEAFAQARDCVIVSTSTLELGIDVGDLDRVIQINSPPTVASFLQRLGRTGRRSGSVRNCLFLTLDHEALLRAAGLLMLWGQGFVEPVVPPPQPRHIVAQQLLALCLQEHRIGTADWAKAWNGLAPFDASAQPILRHLLDEGFVDRDGELLFIGPAAERKFGHRHFMGMTAVFTAPPQFTVLAGRQEIGRTDPIMLTERVDGPRLLLLAGSSWKVTWIDWRRRRCHVEPAEGGGKAKWHSPGMGGDHFEMTRAARSILLGNEPPVSLTTRGATALVAVREKYLTTVHPEQTVIARVDDDVRWWTWAGHRANATLSATLSGLTDATQRIDDASIRLRNHVTPALWKRAVGDAAQRLCPPLIDERAVAGLKFNEALPAWMAEITLAARSADFDGASTVLGHEAVRFVTTTGGHPPSG
ncbi:MAG: DEAD/DEAH box helicase [Kineosporiaceae bacterium]